MLFEAPMTTIRLLLFSGLALVTITGCTDNFDGPIDYQLGGGFSGMHTSVHIEPDGKVTRTQRDGSVDTTQLDAVALGDLQGKVDQAQFPTLEPMYGCGGCADDIVHTISVRVDGSSYTVQADGSADYPDRLRPLIDALSTMAREPAP
jgi:hypothetical protein